MGEQDHDAVVEGIEDAEEQHTAESEQGEYGEAPEQEEDPEGEYGDRGDQGDDEGETRVVFDEKQQEFIEKKIVGPKVAKYRETERENETLRQQLQELQSKLPQEDGAPEVPELPDPWDSDYERKMQERDQALQARRDYEIRKELQEYQRHQAEEQQMRQAQEQLQKSVETYNGRAKELGYTKADLQPVGQAFVAHGVSGEISQHILEHEYGPAIGVYLSERPSQLDDLASMSPTKAALFIEREVVPNAKRSATRRKAPPPQDNPQGGTHKGTDPILKGAEFV